MIRRARLITGLILFAYVTTHLLNHTLGLVSYPAMEDGRVWFLALWRNLPMTVLLYGALGIHFSLALYAIYARRHLRYSVAEGAQLLLGIVIPLLLVGHVLGTRLAFAMAGTNDNYAYVLLAHFRFAPEFFYLQTAGLFASWIHGCIGLHYWLRLKRTYPAILPYLYPVAIILPVLAFLGYVEGGRDVLALYEDKEWRSAARVAIGYPTEVQAAEIKALGDVIFWSIAGAVLLAFGARLVRDAIAKRHGIVRISYPDARIVGVIPGTTILEASRANNIPHASVCGGRGRCSTCRIRLIEGTLPPPGPEERRVLRRIDAPPEVRLACQSRPLNDITIMPLMPPTIGPSATAQTAAYHLGIEREVVILFADIRDFTRFSEEKLPYDVVFVLNRYFQSMGSAIQDVGGRLDKFTGDGVMALFGVRRDIGDASLRALKAAKLMSIRLDELNRSLTADLKEPLRIGIGLHVGTAIVGDMGYGEAISLTAIGDVVNTASRLESATKEFGAQLVVSAAVAAHAGVDLSAFRGHALEVRGKSETIEVRILEDARTLPVDVP